MLIAEPEGLRVLPAAGCGHVHIRHVFPLGCPEAAVRVEQAPDTQSYRKDRLPGEHVGDGVVDGEAAPAEEEEHAPLQRTLKAVDVVGKEVRRPVEGDAPSSPSEETPSRTTRGPSCTRLRGVRAT